MFGIALPLLFSGISSAVRAIGGKKKREAAADNNLIKIQNQLTANLTQRSNINPLQPFGTLARGRLFGAIAKAWGLDQIVGNELIDHIGKASSVPGTQAIGGRPFSTDPSAFGLSPFTRPKTGGALLDAVGGVIGGAAQGLSGVFPTGGGGGVPGGVPGGLPPGVGPGTQLPPPDDEFFGA